VVYPKSEETVRPYRLWNAKENKQLRWRYYQILTNAHNAALLECRMAKVGTVIHVFNATTGKTANGDFNDFEYIRHAATMTIPKPKGAQ
jgi:hypothetical protein